MYQRRSWQMSSARTMNTTVHISKPTVGSTVAYIHIMIGRAMSAMTPFHCFFRYANLAFAFSTSFFT